MIFRTERPTAATIVAPVRPGNEQPLRQVLAAMSASGATPFAGVGSTHFARFVLIGALPGGDGEPAGPPGAYLLFGADFDGSFDDWTAALANRIGAEIDAVLGHCEGYPSPSSTRAEEFRSYLARHDVGAGFSVISYKATVPQIRKALALQTGLRSLANRAGELTAAELQSEWGRLQGESAQPSGAAS